LKGLLTAAFPGSTPANLGASERSVQRPFPHPDQVYKIW